MRKGSSTTSPAITSSCIFGLVSSSEPTPTILILSFVFFFDHGPGLYGLRRDRILRRTRRANHRVLAMRSFMMPRTVAGLPSATFSAAISSALYFAVTTSLETFGAVVEGWNSGPGSDHHGVAFGISGCLRDRYSEGICCDATGIHVVGRQERRHSLGIGGGLDADSSHFLGGLIDRLSKCCKFRGRDDDGRRVRATALRGC